MHPNRAFHWNDEAEMLAFVDRVSFATICVDGPAMVHAPVTAGPGGFRFHVSRSNRAVPRLDGARAIVSVLGPDAYISPDWYGVPDQVPTWNYLAVEAEGPLRQLDEADLVALLDDLGARHEARLAPKPEWTRDKMDPARFEAMVKAIVGFELTVEEMRGTRKLGQHKAPEQRAAVSDALDALGMAELAGLSRPISSTE